jgi:hypothetical protein
MDPEDHRIKRVEKYTRRVEIKRRVEEKGGKILAKGARRGVESRMNRKKTAPSCVVGVDIVLE